MINEFALVFIGMLIGALIYFVVGWVTLDRTVQELTFEARTMRSENEELRTVVRDLAKLVDSVRETRPVGGVALAGPLAMTSTSLDESILSVAVEREGSGRARAQALLESGYFQR